MVVKDNEYIDNINDAMLMVLEYKNKTFGNEYVIEDGKITEIHKRNKIIKRSFEDGQNQ